MPISQKFVIDLRRLRNDTSKVSSLLTKLGKDMNFAGFYTPGFDFAIQANAILLFPESLRALINFNVKEMNNHDAFNNEWKGYTSYDFVELAVDLSYNVITSIRLLGDTKKKTIEQIRFALFDIDNELFTPTTINTVSNIKEISDGITEFFGADNTSLSCNVNSSSSRVPLLQNRINSNIEWSNYIKEYVIPKPKILSLEVNVNLQCGGEVFASFLSEFETKSFKTDEEKIAEEQIWESVEFKKQISEMQSRCVEVINTSADILEDPTALVNKIQTLGDAYSQFFDKISLECLIKSAMKCIAPPLTCKEILAGFELKDIESKIELAFPNVPRIASLVKKAATNARTSFSDEFEAASAFLDEIEEVIDLEVICDVAKFNLAFQIPTIELPELPIIDLFASVEIAIEDAILSALTVSILEMLLKILEDLQSCNNLDSFIAGAINGQIPTPSELNNDLNKMFGLLVDSDPLGTSRDIVSSLGSKWQNFVKQAEPLLNEQVKLENQTNPEVLGEAAQLRNQIDSYGGLESLLEAVEGNIGVAAARAVFVAFFQGQINFSQLLVFQGTDGATALRAFFNEIGLFEIDEEEKSFVLRMSDEQSIVVFNAIGRASRANINTSGAALVDTIGGLLNDVVAVLSPADTLNLLAGTPSLKVVEVIIELIKVSREEIHFINKPDQIIQLFKTLGDATGTSAMKNGVVLASNVRRNRDIPRKFCPEDDEALRLQEQILIRSFPPEEVRTIIDEIIEKRRIRYNELGDILVRLGDDDFSPTEILEPILCGFNPDGSRPAIVDDALNTTINTIFESTKMAFDREIPRYPDALSSEEKITRIVPRTIRRNGDRPVFGSDDGNLFGTFTTFLEGLGLDNPFDSEGNSERIINPEWSKIVSQGLVPPEGDGSARDNRLGPFTEGPPVPIQDVVKRVGVNFKRAFKFEDAVTIKQSNENSFEVQIKGSLPVQSPVQQFSPVPATPPSWVISYKEQDQILSLSLAAQGFFYSSRLGRVEFSDNFHFSEDFSRDLSPEILERTAELNRSVDGVNSKPEIFSSLLKEKLTPAIEAQNVNLFEASAELFFKDRYEEFVKSFLTNAGKKIANNRLLKKIPNQSLDHLGPGTSEFNSKEQTETLILNLINFSATPTDGQKRCKADPHLLDLEFIKSIVKSEYDKDCETESNNDGVSRSKGPMNSSGFVGVVLTVVRLYVIEYVLRGLFVFDEYGYKTEFAEDQLLIDYVSFRIKKDLERQGELAQGTRYYDAFEREVVVAYKKLLKNEDFGIEEEELPLAGPDGVPAELKILVREQLKSVLEKIGEIVGVNSDSLEDNLIKDLLSNVPNLDTFSLFGNGTVENSDYTSLDSRMSSLFQPERKESIPFPPVPPQVAAITDSEGKYAIERYIRVPLSSNESLRTEQQRTGLKDVVNFKNFEEFLSNNEQFNNKRMEELFEEPFKYGYRLVFISPVSAEAATVPEINNSQKSFKLNGPIRMNLRDSVLKSEKAFHVLEKEKTNSDEPVGKLNEFLSNFGLDIDVGSTVPSPIDELLIPELPVYKQFNTVPIAQVEISIDNFSNIQAARGNILNVFKSDYESRLLEELSNSVDVRTLFEYCFFSKRLITFMLIQSSMVLNSEDMKFLFEGTKIELKKLFDILRNMGDYTSKSDEQFLDGVPGNAGAYKAEFDQIGSPSGPKSPDAFYLSSITPILILRGLAELIDPNIAITAKIVAAGNAGYLLPKFVRLPNGKIKLSGTEDNPGPPVIQFTPVGIINPNTGFECIVRASDDLPSWADEETLVEWKSPILPSFPGLPELTLPPPGGLLTIPRGPNREIFGLDRSFNTENPNSVVLSVPEFPGESINLPYGLVSLALLPMQLFFPLIGNFAGPPYNINIPLGIEFLKLEPLIYQLPNYKFSVEDTDVATELLASEGIDLGAAKRIKCKDNTEATSAPSDITESDPTNPNLPKTSDSC